MMLFVMKINREGKLNFSSTFTHPHNYNYDDVKLPILSMKMMLFKYININS